MLIIISQNYKEKTAREISIIINEIFGTNKSAEAVHSKGNHHGFNMTRG